ncbi:MAG TPA: hypothetical protein VG897_00705 [Terriglobales bacterium]|nr:hypothetical protein [Terriglobales bacterium]
MLSRVSAALDVLKRFEKMEYSISGSQGDTVYGQGVSDNVIVVGQPHWVLCEVSALAQSLLQLGFAIRGGIASGKIYCSNRVVFGPALVRAVDIEKAIARVPRVVLDESVLRNVGREGGRPDASKLIGLDQDGQSYVDFLELPATVAKAKGLSYLTCLPPLRLLIVDSLNAHKENPNLRKKYEWLASYFNATIRRANLSWIAPIQ